MPPPKTTLPIRAEIEIPLELEDVQALLGNQLQASVAAVAEQSLQQALLLFKDGLNTQLLPILRRTDREKHARDLFKLFLDARELDSIFQRKTLQLLMALQAEVLHPEAGEVFDENTMDCFDMVGEDACSVIEVVTPGLLLEGYTLIPAQVVLGTAEEAGLAQRMDEEHNDFLALVDAASERTPTHKGELS